MIEIKDYLKDYTYCESLVSYKRYKTREVNIGGLKMGGDNPIRIQSMTTAPTMKTEETIEEVIRLIESGCELVRITAPSKREAENLKNIKEGLHAKGYNTPLVADIHFTPNAAEIAARIVEKVRINPGNYADKKKFDVFEFTDKEYEGEIERIRKKFIPLVDICKEHGTAMRIGTNHGSLSDRIMNRFGDTPVGMVESAMEFLRIAEERDYHNIVLSMKASNPKVMVEAYRLLVAKMREEGMNYPLHLGVTEAGDGDEARIKSAAGIGTLLEDGLGDTVRVSLTEKPENEAPVAKMLVERYSTRTDKKISQVLDQPIRLGREENAINPFEYRSRHSFRLGDIGSNEEKRVFADLSNRDLERPLSLDSIDYKYEPATDKWNLGMHAADYAYLGTNEPGFEFPTTLGRLYDYNYWKEKHKGSNNAFPLLKSGDLREFSEGLPNYNHFILLSIEEFRESGIREMVNQHSILIIKPSSGHSFAEMRKLFYDLNLLKIQNPVIIHNDYEGIEWERLVLHASTDLGGLFIEGYGDGIWINYSQNDLAEAKKVRQLNSLNFGILQASGARISKTEFIACPSCGRTQFDLQETTAYIKGRTNHLKGVKIAVMGCIVNGPGEMADADYGYVGTGPGKITLYKGKEVVRRNLKSEYALDELIELIKADDKWVEA